MKDENLLRFILDQFQPKFPFKITDAKIIIDTRDLPEFLKDIRAVCTYDYGDPGIFFAGKTVIVYNTLEEFMWQVILQ